MPEIQPASQPHLSFMMKHQLGALEIDAAFDLTQPWTVLFAPSGAGKTTILRAIAGLFRPHHARIVSSGQVELHDGGTMALELVLTDTFAGLFTPPHRRSVRMVGHNAALFPHLNVLENVRYKSFGAARTPEERGPYEERLQSLLDVCRAKHLTAKMPNQLSGGERQRVAVARSLVAPDCNLLMLDEPFTGLDTALRDELISDLRIWLRRRNVPVLSVSHDISEAIALDAEVIKLHSGSVAAQGTVAEVLAEERTRLLVRLNSG